MEIQTENPEVLVSVLAPMEAEVTDIEITVSLDGVLFKGVSADVGSIYESKVARPVFSTLTTLPDEAPIEVELTDLLYALKSAEGKTTILTTDTGKIVIKSSGQKFTFRTLVETESHYGKSVREIRKSIQNTIDVVLNRNELVRAVTVSTKFGAVSALGVSAGTGFVETYNPTHGEYRADVQAIGAAEKEVKSHFSNIKLGNAFKADLSNEARLSLAEEGLLFVSIIKVDVASIECVIAPRAID